MMSLNDVIRELIAGNFQLAAIQLIRYAAAVEMNYLPKYDSYTEFEDIYEGEMAAIRELVNLEASVTSATHPAVASRFYTRALSALVAVARTKGEDIMDDLAEELGAILPDDLADESDDNDQRPVDGQEDTGE